MNELEYAHYSTLVEIDNLIEQIKEADYDATKRDMDIRILEVTREYPPYGILRQSLPIWGGLSYVTLSVWHQIK